LTASARDVVVTAGRDEETVPVEQRNVRDQPVCGSAVAAMFGGGSWSHGIPRATMALMKISSFLAQAMSARLWPFPAAISRL